MTLTPLGRWLDTVTAPFPPDTARRIRRELEEHAFTHADTLREAGHSDPEGAALAALGSAAQVQHALMGAHFTRAEEEELLRVGAYRSSSRLPAPGTLLLGLLCSLLMPGWIFLQSGDSRPEAWGLALAWWSAYLLPLLISWRVARTFPARSAGVVGAWLSDLFWPVTGFLMLFPGVFLHGPGYVVWPLLVSGLLLAALVTVHGRVWALLPKALRGAR